MRKELRVNSLGLFVVLKIPADLSFSESENPYATTELCSAAEAKLRRHFYLYISNLARRLPPGNPFNLYALKTKENPNVPALCYILG